MRTSIAILALSLMAFSAEAFHKPACRQACGVRVQAECGSLKKKQPRARCRHRILRGCWDVALDTATDEELTAALNAYCQPSEPGGGGSGGGGRGNLLGSWRFDGDDGDGSPLVTYIDVTQQRGVVISGSLGDDLEWSGHLTAEFSDEIDSWNGEVPDFVDGDCIYSVAFFVDGIGSPSDAKITQSADCGITPGATPYSFYNTYRGTIVRE